MSYGVGTAEDGVDDVLDADAVGDGLEAEVQPVPEHGVTEGAQVLGDDERSALHQRVGAAHLLQGDGATRAGAELDVLGECRVDHVGEATGRLGDRHGVPLDRIVDVDPGRHVDQKADVVEIDHRLQVGARVPRTPRSMRSSTSSSSSAVG